MRRTPLVVQWIRHHLHCRGHGFGPWSREDSTRHGATRPMHHRYWGHALEPKGLTTKPEHCGYWAWALQLLSPSTAATEPEHCGYWAQALQLLSPSTVATEPEHYSYWAWALQLLSPSTVTTEPEHLELVLCSSRSHRARSLSTARNRSLHLPQLEKARTQQWRPAQLRKLSKWVNYFKERDEELCPKNLTHP